MSPLAASLAEPLADALEDIDADYADFRTLTRTEHILAALRADPRTLEAMAEAVSNALSYATDQDETYEFSCEPGSRYVWLITTDLLAALLGPTGQGGVE